MPACSWNAETAARAAARSGFGPLEFHPTLGSTNDRLAALAEAGAAAGQLVVAEAQSAGRGRAGRAFSSPPGGLYVSLLLRLEPEVLARYPLSLVAGLSLCEALEALGVPAQLKWPNDVWIEGRKVAGILVEVAYQGPRPRAVIGLGVNVETDPAALPPEAISLAETASAPRRPAVLERLLTALRLRLDQLEANDLAPLRAGLAGKSALLGARVRAEVDGRPLEGIALGLAPSGALRIQPDSGPELALMSGDVQHVRGV
ncbi:MAG: biotin--[acetyl-CoA-carboxylase] ligase [Planctomycetes bacterium]|nr:biotin--[acetyl-CoA-carboxylase] ligase [Planctomycetota bacterium]